MARSFTASNVIKIITVSSLILRYKSKRKGKEKSRKKRGKWGKDGEKYKRKLIIARRIGLNFYTEDRDHKRKRKRWSLCTKFKAYRSLSLGSRHRTSLFVRRYCKTAKSFSLPRFNQARFWKNRSTNLPLRWRYRQKLFDPSSDNSITMIIG